MSLNHDLKDYFAKLSLEGINLTDPQKWWYQKKSELLREDMTREFPSTPEEAFSASQEGYWYASYMKELWDSGRITNVSYDRFLSVHGAFDLGQADCTSIWFFQLPHSGEINIIDFWERNNTPLDQMIIVLKEKQYNYGTHIWPHDANSRDRAGITFVQQARALGLTGIVLEPHSILQGINQVRTMFSKCWFDKTKCAAGLKHLECYKKRWSSSLGGWTSEPAHDAASHACLVGDTLIATQNGEKRIDQITIEDKVLTPRGYRRVVKTFEYEVKNMISVSFGQHSIICTPNHKIFTERGLIYADELRYNDTIYTIQDRSECQKLFGLGCSKTNIGFRESFLLAKTKSPSSLMDIVIVGMGSIIPGIKQRLIHFLDFIEQFGRYIMEKFQIIITYITKMGILKIMNFQTLSLSAQVLTLQNICKILVGGNSLERAFCTPWSLLRNGMLVLRARNGIESMGLNVGEKERLGVFSAEFVKSPLSLSGLIQNSVPINAKANGESGSSLTSKKGNVLSVLGISGSTSMLNRRHVVSCAESNSPIIQKVYDFEVEHDHCYYANGILVSNSDAFRYLCAGIDRLSGSAQAPADAAAITRRFFGG